MELTSLIQTVGYAGILAIVFAESGLLIGFFLPGDSLLFTAGFLASQDLLSLPALLIGCFVAAVVGDNVGYMFGHRVGKKLFTKQDSIWFHKDHIVKAQRFYEKHGPKTIVLARFLPVVRTFAPIVAGMGSMTYRTFMTYNLIGGGLWVVGLIGGGYLLGGLIPDVDKYLLPIIGLIVVLSVAPTGWHLLKEKDSRERILAWIKQR